MSNPKTTIPRGGIRNTKGTRPAARRTTTSQLSFPQQILEGLREMAEIATSDEPPEKRHTVRYVTLDLMPSDYTPDRVRATREVFGLSQPLFAKFLGVEVSALRHWEQGIRSPLSRCPPIPGRDERYTRPLASKDRHGGSEDSEGRGRKELKVTKDETASTWRTSVT
jgi:DNA-binding transcriptional regulator YiaG